MLDNFNDKRGSGQVWGAEDALPVAVRMARNYDEDCGFADILDRFARKEFAHVAMISVAKTPHVLALGGADVGLDLAINPRTILKCMAPADERCGEHFGHDLGREIFKYLIYEVRNPIFLLKGSQPGSLVAVTDLIDNEGRPVIVSIALDRLNAHHKVNQITSAYGRNIFPSYLKEQFSKGNLIAYNSGKAGRMLRETGLELPTGKPLYSFDNSIAYTFENVRKISVERFRQATDFVR